MALDILRYVIFQAYIITEMPLPSLFPSRQSQTRKQKNDHQKAFESITDEDGRIIMK